MCSFVGYVVNNFDEESNRSEISFRLDFLLN